MRSSPPLFLAVVLAGLAALAPFAIDTYLPAFQAISRALKTSDIAVQQTLSIYLFFYALMTLFHGAVSDAIGRLNAIKWGLFIFVVASVGCAFSPNIECLLFFRGLQGLSGGVGNTVARAMVRDLFEGKQAQKVMATVQMLFGIAPAVAPIIGGLLLGVHWRAIFLFLAIYAAMSVWAALKFLPETMPAEKRLAFSAKEVLRRYQEMFSNVYYLRLCVALGANFAAFFIFVLASPKFLGEHLHLSAQQYGYLFVPTVLGMVLGSFLSQQAAGRYSSAAVIKAAYAWMLLIALLNLGIGWQFKPHLVLNILPVALYNVGMALAMPILSIAALDCYPKMRGTAASGQVFVQMLFSTLSAAVVVPLVWGSMFSLAVVMMCYVLLAWAVHPAKF